MSKIKTLDIFRINSIWFLPRFFFFFPPFCHLMEFWILATVAFGFWLA